MVPVSNSGLLTQTISRHVIVECLGVGESVGYLRIESCLALFDTAGDSADCRNLIRAGEGPTFLKEVMNYLRR